MRGTSTDPNWQSSSLPWSDCVISLLHPGRYSLAAISYIWVQHWISPIASALAVPPLNTTSKKKVDRICICKTDTILQIWNAQQNWALTQKLAIERLMSDVNRIGLFSHYTKKGKSYLDISLLLFFLLYKMRIKEVKTYFLVNY